MRDRKDHFMNSLMEYSSSGRFVGQDSKPPTPRVRDGPVVAPPKTKSPYDLVTAEDFMKNLPPAPLNGSNGHGASTGGANGMDMGVAQSQERPANASGANGTLRRIKGMVKSKSISLGLIKGPTDGEF